MIVCKFEVDGYCTNPKSRGYEEICDIDPLDCQEDGIELIESK